MQSLLVTGMFGHDGVVAGTSFQNACSMGCLWAGVALLAVGLYLLLKAPHPKEVPVSASRKR